LIRKTYAVLHFQKNPSYLYILTLFHRIGKDFILSAKYAHTFHALKSLNTWINDCVILIYTLQGDRYSKAEIRLTFPKLKITEAIPHFDAIALTQCRSAATRACRQQPLAE
jgi:hypothetical protein